MIHDAALPPTVPTPGSVIHETAGVGFVSARWSPASLGDLVTHLAAQGPPALSGLDTDTLAAGWKATVATFLEPSSDERRPLTAPLAATTGLSAGGLEAALATVLGGVGAANADQVFAHAAGPFRQGPVLVVLASNIPGLAVQPLLPLLAARRPVLLKSSRREPFFAPAFVRALVERVPEIADATAAVCWPGGDAALETAVLPGCDRIVVYGGREAMASIEAQAPGRVLDYGPKASLAVIGAEVDPRAIASGLARDIALFDQRGCLSVQAIYTAGPAEPLASELAGALEVLADRWPPGPADPVAAAHVHQLRVEAQMRGLALSDLDLATGTVVVEPLPAFKLSPGLRTVRIHPVPDLERLPALLGEWRGLLQGVAIAGSAAAALAPDLAALGVTRVAAPGDLQSPDSRWLNGGRDLLDLL